MSDEEPAWIQHYAEAERALATAAAVAHVNREQQRAGMRGTALSREAIAATFSRAYRAYVNGLDADARWLNRGNP